MSHPHTLTTPPIQNTQRACSRPDELPYKWDCCHLLAKDLKNLCYSLQLSLYKPPLHAVFWNSKKCWKSAKINILPIKTYRIRQFSCWETYSSPVNFIFPYLFYIKWMNCFTQNGSLNLNAEADFERMLTLKEAQSRQNLILSTLKFWHLNHR